MITFLDRKKAVSNVKKEDVYNSGFMLPLGTITKCQKKKKKRKKLGGEVLQVFETIWTVIKSAYCILHLCQLNNQHRLSS